MDLTLGPDSDAGMGMDTNTPAADLDSSASIGAGVGVGAGAGAGVSDTAAPSAAGVREPLITARKVRERLASVGTWAGADGRPLQGTRKLPEQVSLCESL